MFFSYDDVGSAFELFTLPHVLAILGFAILPVFLLIRSKDRIRASKHERTIRISLAMAGMLCEWSLYAWYLLNGVTDWRIILPSTLCPLTLYLSAYCMVTLDRKFSSIVYFYSYGAFFSFLLADVVHGFDRFRFYLFFLVHASIFVNVVYLRVVNKVVSDKQAKRKAQRFLFPFILGSIVLNELTGQNFFYLKWPPFKDFPVFQQVYDVHWIAYALLCIVCYYLLIEIMGELAILLKIDRSA